MRGGSCSGRWLLREQPAKAADPTVIEELDAWENRWFPVAEATLRRRKPEIADRVFLNLTQTSGLEVAVSVSTFLQRLRELEKDGTVGPEALAILKTRGLTEGVLTEAEALLKKFGSVSFAPPTRDPEEAAAIRDKAEQELWAWYMEWGTIARNSIQNGNLLRGLGFLTSPGGKITEEPDDGDLPLPATTTQLAMQPNPTR